MRERRLSSRILSIVLAFTMIITLIPQISFGADSNIQVKQGSAEVKFGTSKAYDVNAEVTVEKDKITNVVLSHNAAESGHEDSVSFAEQAKEIGNRLKNTGADKESIKGVDAVSGATITSEAYKTAVLNALGMNVEKDFTFGSGNTVLEPGVYRVPVSLRHVDRHEDESMAASAFPSTVKLIINEDGTGTIEAEMKAVEKANLRDMAQNIKVYQGNNTSSETKDVTIMETVKNPEGIYKPDPEKDKIVPSKISFQIPDNHWDGVYMSLWVEVLNYAPDAWLRIDYDKAEAPGTPKHYKGEAKVNQFGKYTIFTDVTVIDGEITDVAVTADNFISETHRPTNELKIAQAAKSLKSIWNGMAPTQENAEKIFKKIMKEDDPDQVIDGISGATYSGKAVRDAVMDAFDLTYVDEVIHVPENVEPGVYEVEIGYYSDVVWHSLIENVKGKAILTVNHDKSMTLELDTFSGTSKEPLYILGFNGVYKDNDLSKELTMKDCSYKMGLSVNDYEDEFFEKGTPVVTHLKFPLYGGLQKVYNTNAYLYVPAMKGLNGELSGVDFKDGHFNVDVFAKIYWDEMKKTGEVPEEKEKLENVTLDSNFTKVNTETYKYTSTGKQVNAKPVVKDRKGRKLTPDKDYKVSYSHKTRVNPGKYTITVKGMGKYTGTVERKLVITPEAPEKISGRLSRESGGYDDIAVSWSPSKGASGYYVSYRKAGSDKWSDSVRTTKTSYVKKNLTDGTTYEFKVRPYVTRDEIRYSSGKYRTVKVTTMKKVSLSSVKKHSSSRVKVSWKNISGESGYQISQSSKKTGTNIVYTWKTGSGKSINIKAGKNKTYYYKVRAYKNVTVNGKTTKVYAPWSNVKSYKLR